MIKKIAFALVIFSLLLAACAPASQNRPLNLTRRGDRDANL